MTDVTTREKWDRIYQGCNQGVPPPARVLAENAHLLPLAGGHALDLACGLGGNALFLAQRGFRVDAVDISPVAIETLRSHIKRQGLSIHAWSEDVCTMAFPTEGYRVIVVSRFLERSLAHPIFQALEPGGLLFYQTFTAAKVSENGPRNPNFLLQDNELPQLFAGLSLRYYRDEGRVGDIRYGLRDEACFIGQKPPAAHDPTNRP